MGKFITRIKFRGKMGKHDFANLNIDSGDFGGANIGEDGVLYQSAQDQVVAALSSATLCSLEVVTASYILSADGTIPSNDLANTGRALALKVHLVPKADGRSRTKVIYVPAPIPEMFIADGLTLDVNNSVAVNLVSQLAQHARFSDGEQIDSTAGASGNGIHSGELKSIPKDWVR